MATVRIYKVAELLGTTSQEVSALLKRDHGIEAKSASSTIEEVVARQFVERLAKQRRITLPTGDIFAETPAAKGGKKPSLAKKPAEPVKPAAPALPPPRLVKHKPAAPPGTVVPAAAHAGEPQPAPVPPSAATPPAALEVSPVEAPVEPEPAPPALEPVAPVEEPVHAAPEPVAEVPPAAEVPAEQAPAAPAAAPPQAEPGPPAAAAAPAAPPKPVTPPRHVPQRIRLRIEEERPTTPTPPLPTTVAPRVVVRPQPPRPAVAPTPPRPAVPQPGGVSARPGTTAPGQRPGAMPPRPPYSGPAGPRPTPGGPRPLPSQPVRTQPPGVGPRPPQYPHRPGMPSRPPMRSGPGGRPGGSGPRRDQGSRPSSSNMPSMPPPVTRTITLAEGMTVKDLADKLDVRVKDVLGKLLMKRLMMTINSTLDTETATMLAREFGADVQMRSFEEELLQTDADDVRQEDIVARAPVVTVMGHVDHGKTSLLDAVREARVAEREAGGITQHIGAYHVTINGRNIVFLDTPGHEAFTLMRARGAKVTDIVILVVAADDGVMPQTREAIDHARAANVPIIVAINKIDKPNANPERVKRELTDLDLMPEEWGGKTVTVEVSAKKRQNLDALLEMVLLVSELGELKANPKRHASGTVLESKLDKGRGPVATVLVQDGTLSVGDTFIAGPIVGRVRALIDDRGRPTKSAGPSTPVEV
ncbi:MAG: translation initiation factor IF-2, partial [Vicinamibacterales bacterium]